MRATFLAAVLHLSAAQFGDLILDEEFTSLNFTRWQHEITLSGGGNWEFEYYTNNRSNSYVRDGVLYIKPTLTNNTLTAPNALLNTDFNLWGSVPGDYCTANAFYGCERQGTGSNPLNPVQSARIRTVKSFSFKYGKIEVRAQLPRGDWLWPAVWLLPRDNAYGQWPASGEIDLIEARANAKLTTPQGDQIGVSEMVSTLHWGPYYGADMYTKTQGYEKMQNGLLSDDFHVWSLEWTPSGFSGSFDGQAYFSVNGTDSMDYWKRGEFDTNFPNSFNPWAAGNGGTDAPFDQEFFLVINLAVGGTSGFFPDGSTSSPGNGMGDYTKPWSDKSSTAYSDFWNTHMQWYPTWQPFVNNGENAALKVDYIKVYEYTG